MVFLGIVLSAPLSIYPLRVQAYGASPVVEWRGWYVDDYNVTVAVVGQSVTTSWFASGAPVNDYRLRIMQQISGSPPAEMTRLEVHYGGGSQSYSLSFVPSVATGETNTLGYYADLWGKVASVWTLLWTMDNVYPPRLTVLARSPMQGDLTLNNSDVAVIDGTMNANGSIHVADNSTLILKNAALNFTQTGDYQFGMDFGSAVNDHPRFIVDNATMTSNFEYSVEFYGNSTANITKLTTDPCLHAIFMYYSSSVSASYSSISDIYATDYSSVTASNCTFGTGLGGYVCSSVSASNCTMQYLDASYNSTVAVVDSAVALDCKYDVYYVNCTVDGLRPGHFDRWNFKLNSSVMVGEGGFAPNLTLVNTTIQTWSFGLFGSSNATFSNSSLRRVFCYEHANVTVSGGIGLENAVAEQFAVLYVYDTQVSGNTFSNDAGIIWLTNSPAAAIYAYSMVFVRWYLDVHVLDSIGQDVPSALVSARFPNSTLAEGHTTNSSGWTTLTLMEKMVNKTGSYPVGDYNVSAAYLAYSNFIGVNVNRSKQITLTLSGLIVPEFPSSLILPLFMMATILATIAFRKKRVKLRALRQKTSYTS